MKIYNNFYNFYFLKFYKLIIFIFLIIFNTFMLTGCYDKVELEERGLVLSIGIDKNIENNNFIISVSMPDIITEGGSSNPTEQSQSENTNQAVKIGEGATISETISNINIDMIKNLYFGHTKVIVIGTALLKDAELLKESIDFLERHREISRKVIILGAENAQNILQSVPNDEKMLGIYINDFYKNNNAYKIDLDDIIQKLLTTGDVAIPNIEFVNNNLGINSLSILRNCKLSGTIDEISSKYLLYLMDKNTLGEISIDFDNKKTGLVFLNKNIDISVREEVNPEEVENKIIVTYNIKSDVNITEYELGENILIDTDKYKILEQETEIFLCESIKTSINNIWDFRADVLGMSEYIRKNNPELYDKYNLDKTNIYNNLKIEIICDINIKGSGKIK